MAHHNLDDDYQHATCRWALEGHTWVDFSGLPGLLAKYHVIDSKPVGLSCYLLRIAGLETEFVLYFRHDLLLVELLNGTGRIHTLVLPQICRIFAI